MYFRHNTFNIISVGPSLSNHLHANVLAFLGIITQKPLASSLVPKNRFGQIRLAIRYFQYVCTLSNHMINWLISGSYGSNFKKVISQQVAHYIHQEFCFRRIVVWWMPQNTYDDKSTLVQIMTWCHQGTSHLLSHCWLRCNQLLCHSMTKYM